NGTHFLGLHPLVSLALGQHYGQQSEDTYYVGDIAEVLAYSRPLSGPERYALGTVLSEKYTLETDFAPLPKFEADIRPILESRCFECHGEETQEAGLDLRTVSAMLRGGKAGPVIVRGHPEYSELVALVESGKMPPEGADPLTPDEQQLLRNWIEADAPAEEHVEIAAPASKVTEQDRQHWAFRMPVAHRPPEVNETGRVRNPIDRFILSKLESQGLTLSDDLGAEQLVRRVCFDLIGLPPSPEEVRQFVADCEQRRPEESEKVADVAYERLIDRLLASEQFGERWGRHWLDVAGFVDVHGSDNDAAIIKPHPGKWRYRDYVIESFNADKPFDQFIIEQLAGDELYAWRDAAEFTQEMRDALTATAFLLSANDDTSQNELNTPDIRHHVLQRTAENVANTLLAVTLECAQCHDHKYEAVSQYDYYRFESVFAPIFNVRSWITVEKRFRPDVSDRRRGEIDAYNAGIDADVAAVQQQVSSIRSVYRARLLEERLAGVAEEQRVAVRTALETPEAQRNDEQKRLASEHAALAVTEADIDAALTPGDREELASLATQIAEKNAQRQRYGEIAVAAEAPGTVVTHLLRRGNYLRPGLEVEPALFDILRPEGRAAEPLAADNPSGSSGRRLALARKLTDPQSLAGHHVARVFVNRVWQQLIGRGIVPSSDNFGVSGQPPTHPELLDWLTHQFLRDGWRVKPTIRRIMLSSTYRQTSAAGLESERAAHVDPENRLLWRMNLRRLDSEQLRDALLAISGKLDPSVGGEPVPLDPRLDGMVVIKADALPTPTSQFRRSIYLLARRNYHLTFLQAFDQPILARTCSVRKPSAVVTQALELMNSDFMLDQADFLAARIAATAGDTIERQITAAYELVLGRTPEDEERTLCASLLERQRVRFEGADASRDQAAQQALAQFCRTLLNTTEFVYLR
ncbi:MAG: PSD1 and planctomycete cytochrome C domain-containing protein, partial [Planctomycetaceae bacterium]